MIALREADLDEYVVVALIGVASIVLTVALFFEIETKWACRIFSGLIYYLGVAAIPTVGVALIADDVVRFATRPYAQALWAPAAAHAALNSDDCQHATCLRFPVSESLARQALNQYSRCLVAAFFEHDASDMGMLDRFEPASVNLLRNGSIRAAYFLTSQENTGCLASRRTERGRGGLLCRESALIHNHLISWIDSPTTTLVDRANCMLRSKPPHRILSLP